MRKIPNHSTNDNKKSKKINDAIQGEKPVKQLVFGEYFNIHTFLKHPVTLSFIERQAQDLRAWAMSDDALLLYDFTDQVGYSPNQFYEWCDKYPVLREAHDFALRRIGARRERGALTRQFAESTIHRTLGHYHKIWKDETLEMYRMKDNIAQAENKIIIIERFPEPAIEIQANTDPEKIALKARRATGDNRNTGTGNYHKKD